MGSKVSSILEVEQTQPIKPQLSKPVLNLESGPKYPKALFTRLSPKSPNIDDELSLNSPDEHSPYSQTVGAVGNEADQFQQESVGQEIKIKWNSFIKMKNKNYLEDYSVFEEIGRGGFGTVNRVKARFTGVTRAAKKIKKSSLGKQEHQKLFQQMAIMINLDHPNIARLFEVYDYKSHYVLILELCEGGELFKRIITKETNQTVAVVIIAQLLKALVYIHGRGIVHRDLKPENLLFEKGSNYLKLIDFGIAVHFQDGEPLTSRIGTPYYIAPEVLIKKYDQKCDVWAVGIILYMMLTYRPPFGGDNQLEVMQKIIKTEPDYECKGLKNVSEDCLNLIKMLLTKNPNKRPSALEAYNHPWIKAHLEDTMTLFKPKTSTLQNLSTFKFSNKLQAVVYTFIVSQILSSAEKRVLKELFEYLDHNHDGVISTEEFRNALIQKKELSQDKIKFLVRVIDTNGSGEIDFTEFIVAAFEPESLSIKHFQQAFSYFDIDHSGFITYDEIATFLEDKENSQDEIRRIFSEVDENNDGEISKQQFLQILMKRSRETKGEARLRKRQAKSDKDKKALGLSELGDSRINCEQG